MRAGSHAMDSLRSATPSPRAPRCETGGERIGNKGYFFEPTVLTDVPLEAEIMNEEPFGPMAPISLVQATSTT